MRLPIHSGSAYSGMRGQQKALVTKKRQKYVICVEHKKIAKNKKYGERYTDEAKQNMRDKNQSHEKLENTQRRNPQPTTDQDLRLVRPPNVRMK